ncbi:MAG: hypothetical protein ACR2H3_15780 [Acidimicrobiales bacterium]
MGDLHRSSSIEQQDAEPLILAAASAQIGALLAPARVELRGGSRVEVDGTDDARTVFVEVYARQGALKGGQVKKVAQDILKLAILSRNWPEARLVLVLASPEAARTVAGRGWLAEAVTEFGIEVLVANIDDSLREGLRHAQHRQVMINPPG